MMRKSCELNYFYLYKLFYDRLRASIDIFDLKI